MLDMTTEPVETVRRIYEAFARGDLDTMLGFCTPETTIAQDPALPWGGRYVGPDGLTEFATKLIGTIDAAVATAALFQAGDQVVQHGRTRGTVRQNGKAFDVAECHVWTIHDGLVSRVEFIIDSGERLAALAP